ADDPRRSGSCADPMDNRCAEDFRHYSRNDISRPAALDLYADCICLGAGFRRLYARLPAWLWHGDGCDLAHSCAHRVWRHSLAVAPHSNRILAGGLTYERYGTG